MSFPRAVAPALASALWLTACDTSAHGRCELAKAQRIAMAHGSSFDAVSLVAQAKGGIALYSDSAGAWARAVTADGGPVGSAVRLGERCPGGMAGVDSGGLLYVTCMRPGSPGSLSLMRIDHTAGAWSVGTELLLASVGPAARGVAIAADGGGVSVLFHDASA
ncbi:MAG: hypothetical protein RL385_3863, partial [Pseudomonadota bacterium]